MLVFLAVQRIVSTLETFVAKVLKLAFAICAFPLIETKTDLGAIRSCACSLPF